MCSVPDGYGSISSWYQWFAGSSPGGGFGVWKACSSAQTRCHLASISCGLYLSTAPLRQTNTVLELFPDTAGIAGGELAVGGVSATALAEEHGTPLVVYCEDTVRAAARAYRRGAPDAVVVYGTKAFPNVAIMRLLAEEGIGADVSTLGELRYAQAAGVPAERTVVHGNNKSDAELAAAAEADAWLVVMDEPGEVERCAALGVRRVLLRVTPGIEAGGHEKIMTGHLGSKFGVAPEQALEVVERARSAGLEMLGLHVHLGSQIAGDGAVSSAVERLAALCVEARERLGWTPAVMNLGGGLGIRHVLGRAGAPGARGVRP